MEVLFCGSSAALVGMIKHLSPRIKPVDRFGSRRRYTVSRPVTPRSASGDVILFHSKF